MQSYDFLYLHNNCGCNMQLGGDGQWSNMLAGSPDRAVTKAELADGVKLKKGKKVFHKAILAEDILDHAKMTYAGREARV